MLLFLLAYVPAPLMVQWLSDDWGPQVQVLGSSGNLWRGQAVSVNFNGIVLQSVEWRWRPQSLLIGRISHRLNAQTSNGSLDAIVSSAFFDNTLRISALNGSLPVEQLGASLQLPIMPFTGRMQFDIQQLQLRSGRPWLVQGRVDFNDLGFTFTSPPITLGQYHAALSTQKEAIQVIVSSEAGQLEASGSGQITRDGQYALDLMMRPRANAVPSLVSLLQTVGRPNAEGWYLLRRNGAL